MNAGDLWSIDDRISIGMPVRALNVSWDLRNNVDVGRGIKFINGAENDTRVLRNRLRLEIMHYGGDKIDLTATGWITYNRIRHLLIEELNRDCISGTLDARMIWSPSERWSFE